MMFQLGNNRGSMTKNPSNHSKTQQMIDTHSLPINCKFERIRRRSFRWTWWTFLENAIRPQLRFLSMQHFSKRCAENYSSETARKTLCYDLWLNLWLAISPILLRKAGFCLRSVSHPVRKRTCRDFKHSRLVWFFCFLFLIFCKRDSCFSYAF